MPAVVVGQLAEEGTFGSTVAFSERMQHVDLADVMRKTMSEPFGGEAAKMVFIGELREQLSRR